MGKLDPNPMKTLDGMPKGRPIALPKNIRPNLDDIVRAQADKELIERRMVQIAESQSIPDNRLALGFGVGNDMSCVQKLFVT